MTAQDEPRASEAVETDELERAFACYFELDMESARRLARRHDLAIEARALRIMRRAG